MIPGGGPFTGILAPERQARAQADAARRGLAEAAESELAALGPVRPASRSAFRAYARGGDRKPWDQFKKDHARRMELNVLLHWLGRPRLDAIQDLIWEECEQTWWYAPCHEYVQPIDLLAAMRSERLAFYLALLGGELETEVRDRVIAEIRRRVLTPYLDPGYAHAWWRRCDMNWNAVCNGGVLIAALAVEDDPATRDAIVRRALADLPRFLDGFAADGGCSEGSAYWRYGMDWWLRAAWAAADAGVADLMADPRLAAICRFPLAVSVSPGEDLTFADNGGGFMKPALAARIERFQRIPELFGLCRPVDGRIELVDLDDLLLCGDRPAPPFPDTGDVLLPDLGTARLRQGPWTVGVKGGHNAEHHNHNDLGGVIVQRGARVYLADPGGPIYTADTFGPKRYESFFTSSRGHSVPVIDGRFQLPGREHASRIAASGLGSDGERTVTVDFAAAYGLPALTRLVRTVTLPAGGGRVEIADAFACAGDPLAIEEVFISLLPCEPCADGVRIGSDALLHAADTPGTFSVQALPEEDARTWRKISITRIAFTPAQRRPHGILRFVLELPCS